MLYSNVIVIILSILIISCSQNKNDKLNNNTIHISLPIQLLKDDIKKTYVVKKGDTLYSLGLHLKVDYKKIAKWNGIKSPYKIKEGQKLYLDKLLTIRNKQDTQIQLKSVTSKVKLISTVDLPPAKKNKSIGHR